MITVLKFIKKYVTILLSYESICNEKELNVKKNKSNSDVTEVEASDDNKAASKTVDKVGSLLKEMRQQKGLRLSDVAKKLCIRRIYLEAIEEGDYKEIPPIPYGIGFIRSYAEYLGLNSNNIVELYKEETNTNTNKGIYVLEPQTEATVPGRKYLLISLLAVFCIYVLWQVFNKNQPSEEVVDDIIIEENVEAQEQPIVVEDYAVIPEETIIAEKPEDTKVVDEQVTITEESFEEPEVVPATKPEETTVLLKIKDETWVEVKNKDTLFISKVLQAGDEYVVPEGGKGMVLSVGKVDGVDVYINGKIVPVARVNKKTNIELDQFISANH